MERPTPRGEVGHARSRLEVITPAITAAVATGLGFALFASATRQPVAAHTASSRLPPHGTGGSFTPLVASLGVALIPVGWYLWRRRRRALVTAVVLLVVTGVVEGPISRTTVVALLAAGLLIASHDAFPVRSQPFGTPCWAWVVPSLTAIPIIGLLGGSWLKITVRPDLASYLEEAAVGGTPNVWPPVHFATLAFWMLCAGSAAHWAFRSTMPQTRPGGRRAAAELVNAHGSDTLAAFKLRSDLDYHFSSCGAAFAGYRVHAGVLLVAGDPVGRASSIPGLVKEILQVADAHDLRFGAVGASPAFAALCQTEGLHAMYIGDEAMVDPRTFSLEGRAMRKVRQSTHRLERLGYTVECRAGDELDHAALRELDRISTAWRGRAPERGFAMALDTLDSDLSRDVVLFITRDGAGRARAFLQFVPTYGRAALSLSSMRREPGTPNGTTEFLVVRALETLRDRGAKEVSLNFAAFGRLLRAPAGRLDRLLGVVICAADRFFQIESLYRFNAKFRPQWYPRYLVYDGSLALPRIALATLSAEGQIAVPGVGHSTFSVRRHRS